MKCSVRGKVVSQSVSAIAGKILPSKEIESPKLSGLISVPSIKVSQYKNSTFFSLIVKALIKQVFPVQ